MPKFKIGDAVIVKLFPEEIFYITKIKYDIIKKEYFYFFHNKDKTNGGICTYKSLIKCLVLFAENGGKMNKKLEWIIPRIVVVKKSLTQRRYKIIRCLCMMNIGICSTALILQLLRWIYS
jgi:hypothetical protein